MPEQYQPDQPTVVLLDVEGQLTLPVTNSSDEVYVFDNFRKAEQHVNWRVEKHLHPNLVYSNDVDY